MNNDAWLRDLAKTAQEEQDAEQSRLDERWDRLSAGELSPEEEETLRALAETSSEARQAWEAFRPLGPEFQASMVRALQEQRAPAAPAPARTATLVPPVRLLPFRGRATRLGGWLTAAAAVAATLVLFLRIPGAQPPLPGYDFVLSGGVREMRGEPLDRPETFSSGSPFNLVLTPQTAVSGKIEARFFLARGEELRPWTVPGEARQIFPGGVVGIHGTVGREIAIPPGEWTLWAVVGRPGKLPNAEALRAHLGLHDKTPQAPPGAEDWLALKKRLKSE